MVIYDNNWKSYAMYTTCTVESNCDFGCIESGAFAGIGIAQWTYGRSWDLLNKMVTDYPETASLFPILYDEIKPGSERWGRRTFSQSEANEISAALVTDQGVNTQNATWNSDCDDEYIPILRDNCSLTDPKTAVFGLTVYHQAPNAFYQIYSGCGNCDYVTWYNTTLNNGIVGKYRNRQNTVKALLDEWDGSSGKEGFGTTTPSDFEGGNFDPNNGNPDKTWATTLEKVIIRPMEKMGKEWGLNLNVNKQDRKLMFFRASDGLYYPMITEEKVEGETEDTPVPELPPTMGTNEDIDWIVAKIKELESTLNYSQAWDKRTNILGGYCDCSGLVWWLYNERSYNLGTWTGSQINDGELIMEGGGGDAPEESRMQLGDLCLFDWGDTGYTSKGHIELYIGGGEIMGHGGRPPIGPVRKVITEYFPGAMHWMVRRVIIV